MLLTTSEVAKKMRVSPQSVRAWIRSGRLQANCIGRPWRVTEEALEEAIRETLSERFRSTELDETPHENA